MTFPKTGGVELAFPQDNADAVLNGSIRRLDALASRAIIVDRDLTAPPGACADGANYLVEAAPTGLWTGQSGKLATAVGANASNGWTYQTVTVGGYQLYVQDENIVIQYDGAVWITIGTGGYTDEQAQDAIGAILTDAGLAVVTYSDATPSIDVNVPAAVAADFRTGTDATKALTSDAVFDAAVPVVLTDGATVTPDFSAGFNFTWTIAGNRTLANPTSPKPGQTGCIEITQDGTGSRTITYGADYRFAGGTDIVLSTAAGSVDLLFYYVTAGNKIFLSAQKAIAA